MFEMSVMHVEKIQTLPGSEMFGMFQSFRDVWYVFNTLSLLFVLK